MTPADFLREVVEPNVGDAVRSIDTRAAVNAILSLDALAGIIHAHGKATGRPEIARYGKDHGFKEALAETHPGFRVVRDLAASIKHGALTDGRGKLPPRLVSEPSAVRTSGGGMLGFGPLSSGPISSAPTVCIALSDGRIEQAPTVIQDALATLRTIVEGMSRP